MTKKNKETKSDKRTDTRKKDRVDMLLGQFKLMKVVLIRSIVEFLGAGAQLAHSAHLCR